jgi:tRNA threonylcarbamoyladenosine biosynthesis protein TsaB
VHVARVRILAIDTASDTACVGLVEDGVVRAEDLVRVSAQHGETLLPRIADVLARAGVPRSDIDLIAVGLGPGSFTGVRIGLATAKGLALGLGKPIVGVRSSRVLAASVDGASRIVAIDGKKGEIFASAWALEASGLRCVVEDVHGAPDVMAARMRAARGSEVTVVGTALAAYPAFLTGLGAGVRVSDESAVRAAVLASEARRAFVSRGPDDLARLEPVYVRDADALLPGGRPLPS